MAEPQVGDRINVKTIHEEVEGTLMPTLNDALILKLDNGYNMGIKAEHIESIEVLEKHKPKHETPDKAEPKPNLPTISVLHTGGTIASKVDYSTGAVVARFSPEELMAMFPELNDLCNIRSKQVAQIFSEDMRFEHYNLMAKAVAEEFAQGAKGIIITHGTDTMHYTSAALSFMLQNLPGPVILVGAQRSSDRASSDAGINLVCSVNYILKTDFRGVGICMHDTPNDNTCGIFPGVNARKMHSTMRDAFVPVNAKQLARITYPEGKITILSAPKKTEGKFSIQLINDKLKIGMIYTHPSLHHTELNAYEGFDGIVLIGTGLGHFPVNETDELTKENGKILEEIKKLSSSSVVAMSLQTIYGGANMNVYSSGRKLIEAGVLGDKSTMTPETTFAKLAYLLSAHDKKDIQEKFNEDICGENVELREIDQHKKMSK